MSDSLSRRVSRRAALQASAALSISSLPAAARQPRPMSQVDAYTDQLSYAPGDEVKLYVSTPDRQFNIVVVRDGPKVERLLATDDIPGGPREVPKDASSHGCRWPITYKFKLPADCRSGYYRVAFTTTGLAGQSATGSTFFVVRPKEPGKHSKVLLQVATNTYNAYTNWGGYSLYAYNGRHKVQGRRVSFDRPISSQWGRWEQHFVQWAEANGFALDYAVNSDLEFRPELLKHYKLVLSVGHDEYWSTPMRDHLETFIAGGGNVAFFSGNTCCWQVRSEDNGRSLACWKQSFGDDPYYKAGNYKLLSTLWSHYLVGRPENTLTGVGFLHGGYHRSHGQYMDSPGAFTTHRPDHWLFAGTGVKRGEAFGSNLPKYKVVGYECDGCELEWKDGLPSPTYRDGTPEGFEVLATCPARWHPDDSDWYEKWEKDRVGNAVLGTYTRGGTVVTVGSTDWSHGLRGGDPVVTRVTRNVLDRLGR